MVLNCVSTQQMSGTVRRVVGVPDELDKRLRQMAKFVRIDNDAEDRAWRPDAASIEALVLKVLGGWEVLKSAVNWAYFDSVGPDGPPAEAGQLPSTIRKVAESYNVRWPHSEWSAACAKANVVRQKLAHLLYAYKVDNESPTPERKLAFMRLGLPGQPRRVNKRPSELGWSKSAVPLSQQARHVDLLTEQELIDALETIKWLLDCCNYLQRLGSIHRFEPGWPDNYELPKSERDQLAWWFDDWGDPQTTALTAGQLWVRPSRGPEVP